MNYATEAIVEQLKQARKRQGLSQRALADRVGVPQSHLSRIESGAVDLRLSSLIELSRALDLEVSLVPRKNVAAVESIIRSTAPAIAVPSDMKSSAKELARLRKNLDELSNVSAPMEIDQLKSRARELERLNVPSAYLKELKQANATLERFRQSADTALLKTALEQIQSLRNALVHDFQQVQVKETPRAAYSLSDDDHG